MRVYFAGSENKTHAGILVANNAENVLFSYYLMNKNQKSKSIDEKVNWYLDQYEGKNIFCDSGAATLQKGTTEKQFDQIVEDYGEFLVKYSGLFDVCCEMDLYNLFPKEKIVEVREYLDTKCKNLMPVWHVNQTFAEWKGYVERYPFVAIGITKQVSVDTMVRLIKIAYDKGVKVHGFAVTQMKKMLNCPFYSVDSTTWLNGALYGNYLEFKDGVILKHISPTLIMRKKKSNRKVTNTGVVATMEERLRSGVIAFQEMEEYLYKMWKVRGVDWENQIAKHKK